MVQLICDLNAVNIIKNKIPAIWVKMNKKIWIKLNRKSVSNRERWLKSDWNQGAVQKYDADAHDDEMMLR